MKFILASVAALALSSAAVAQDHAGHGAPAASAAAVTGTGVVKKLDAKAGTVTIDHGPIKALNWGAMTMPFKVADASLLNGLKVGAKVTFQLKDQKIVAIKAM
ncbi:MAG: copper-binding protein [Phenylobacterium sp.]|uniref:copper-binding protein n=1 Tax=Phenylobacterium sp. TaxID=1871053 RepID=UPI001A237A15|nr:copper-binding protein [Phenylobacterium sp.]MBJ7413588.1 copper-binding protein [Phenylobacterium sp.]